MDAICGGLELTYNTGIKGSSTASKTQTSSAMETRWATMGFACLTLLICFSHCGMEARTTLEFSLSLDGISFFLDHRPPIDDRRLQELHQAIAAIDDKIQWIDESVEDLRQLLQRQFSASAAVEIENRMRNILDLYSMVLKAVQDLHANRSAYDDATFKVAAEKIRNELKTVLRMASTHLPSDLPSLSRVLLGDIVSGVGSTEGLLCDVVSGTLSKLSEVGVDTYNLTEIIQNGCLAFLSSMTALQELSIALLNNTCTPTDLVCHRQVSQYRGDLGKLRSRMESCLPPGLLQLAVEGRVFGRLLEVEAGRALSLQDVHLAKEDRTAHLPALLPPQDSPTQLLALERRGRFFSVVLGQTCYLTVRYRNRFACTAHPTAKNAMFMVTGNSRGNLRLVETAMSGHLAGIKGDNTNCLEQTISLLPSGSFPWRFEPFIPTYVQGANQGYPVSDAIECAQTSGMAAVTGNVMWWYIAILGLWLASTRASP